MVNISSFYCHYKTDPIKFTFMQYENYIKVLLNKRQIILTNMQLVSNPELFQFFKLSLLCTENTSRIYFDRISTPNERKSIYGRINHILIIIVLLNSKNHPEIHYFQKNRIVLLVRRK